MRRYTALVPANAHSVKHDREAHTVLWGELRVEAVLGSVRRNGVFARGVGCCLRLTEDALLNIDLAVERGLDQPIPEDTRRPVRHESQRI